VVLIPKNWEEGKKEEEAWIGSPISFVDFQSRISSH
jgi:hypothetical protein